jgi:hypothetical protein
VLHCRLWPAIEIEGRGDFYKYVVNVMTGYLQPECCQTCTILPSDTPFFNLQMIACSSPSQLYFPMPLSPANIQLFPQTQCFATPINQLA